MTSHPSPDSKTSADFEPGEDFFGASSSNSNKGTKSKRLLINLLGRWYWAALGLVIGILASSYYLSKAPKRYSATSTLLIKQQTSSIMSRDQIEEIDLRSIEGLNTIAERIRRHELLERVASRPDVRSIPGLIPPAVDWRPAWLTDWFNSRNKSKDPVEKNTQIAAPPAPPVLAGWLGAWMNISIQRGTRLINITFQHEVPEVTKALADAVAREYLAEIAGARTEGRSSKSETLLKQSEEVRGKLQAADSALASYNRAIELHKALESQENNSSRLSRRYLPKHPKMIAADSELEGLKLRFLDEFNVAIRSKADETYWKTAGEEIKSVKDDPEARLRLARQLLLARTGVLRGEIASQMSVFNAMLTRLEESNVNRESEESNVEVSSYARTPGGPSSPNRNKLFTTGGTYGFAFGLAIAYLLVRLDNKYRSVAQIESETRLPVLAAISDIDPSHLEEAARAYLRKHKSVESNPLQQAWDPLLVFRSDISSTNFAEMFRVLRASVSLLGDEKKRKITLFSSALPGEGKSIISSNLALASAGQGLKTLLIDLDLRKPSIHRIFGFLRAKQGPGITEWLASQASLEDIIVRETGCPNLHLVLSGKRAPNPGELLNVSRLKQLFTEACMHYDIIIVDSAPLLSVPDTRVIVPLVNNFCLVVRADFTPKGAVDRTIKLLETSGNAPAGIVFNGFKETRRMIGQNYSYGSYRLSRYGRPYQYGYGSYGAYGSDDDDDTNDKKIISRNRKRNSKRKSKSPPAD